MATYSVYHTVKFICLSYAFDIIHVKINLSLYCQPKTSREMGCQTEEPNTRDGECQTIQDLKQRGWKVEPKIESVFYCFLLYSLFNCFYIY